MYNMVIGMHSDQNTWRSERMVIGMHNESVSKLSQITASSLQKIVQTNFVFALSSRNCGLSAPERSC